jgi:GT2 family glycosyltransferase/spore maturation protein CgeB
VQNLELSTGDDLLEEFQDLKFKSDKAEISFQNHDNEAKNSHFSSNVRQETYHIFSSKGSIEVITLSGVLGWVALSGEDFPVVELRKGDVILGSALADRLRGDLEHVGGKGFFIDTSEDLLGQADQCDLYIDGEHWASLAEFENAASGFDQPVLINNDRVITGVLRKNIPSIGWPAIRVLSNDKDGDTHIVQSADDESGLLHFRIQAYNPASRNASISIFLNDLLYQQQTLESVPIKRTAPTEVGQLDTVGPFFMTGWMIGSNRDDRTVEFLIDGHVVGQTKANRPRPDVEERYGVSDTAYVWPIPKRFKDGRSRRYSARRKSDGTILGGADMFVAMGDGSIQILPVPHGLRIVVTSQFQIKLCQLELRIDGSVRARYPLLTQESGDVHVGNVDIYWEDIVVGVGGDVYVNIPEYSLQAVVPQILLTNRLGNLIGNVDAISNGHLMGWIAYASDHNAVVPVNVFVNGELIASGKASNLRADLKGAGLSNVNHGFRIELPERLFTGTARMVGIRCAITDRLLGKEKLIEFEASARSKRPTLHNSPALWALTRPGASAPVSPLATAQPIVTVIILTRDGAPVLEQCLQSIAQFTDPNLAHVVVVDHASVDNTPAVIARASDKLNLSFHRRRGNGSFSFSNNEIAFTADTPYVLFLNNDVILTSNAIESLLQTLIDDQTVGAVGCKLVEAREGFDTTRTKVHHAGIALNLEKDGLVRAREIGEELSLSEANRPVEVYGVTGACVAMRTDEFRSIGGFPDIYFYGGEDVELSVRVRTNLRKRVVCRNDVLALHYRGYARLTDRGAALLPRIHENERRLNQRLAYYNRKSYQKSVLAGGNNVSLYRGVIGFVVLEADRFARAGEFFTAAELAAEYEALTGCSVVFVTPDMDWYDASGLDCLVVMLHEYDVSQIHSAALNMVLVGWARNHFDYWLDSSSLDAFDLLLSSSSTFVDALMEKQSRSAKVLKIGTRGAAMADGVPNERFKADVIFNGNFAGADRDFCAFVDPSRFDGSFRVVGKGWESHENLKDIWQGGADYEDMPDLYASAKIVIDDANPSARAWGGTNSRVFDALAAGCLVLTNSIESSRIDFDGLLPVWKNVEELYDIVNHYLNDEDARTGLVNQLRDRVLREHTYANRAETLRGHLLDLSGPNRIAIKIGAPTMAAAADWGDLYYAEALGRHLRSKGYNVRIDCLDSWYERNRHDDVAIVLRGLTEYRTQPDQLNFMWLISHPEAVSREELKKYDHIFCSSQMLASHLSNDLPKSVLYQFSDFSKFDADNITKYQQIEAEAILENLGPDDILFVGNTRGVRRDFILDIYSRHPVKFIGKGWDLYVSTDDIIAEQVGNALLPILYRTAGCVINDHWPDMLNEGIVSNRVFDVLASQGLVFSDYIEEGITLFGQDYFCTSAEQFSERWDRAKSDPTYRAELIEKGYAAVKMDHCAQKRAENIDRAIKETHEQRMMMGIKN